MDILTAIGLILVSFLVGWFLRPYFVKRSELQAEYDAILANLDTIKTKVEITERAAAHIKSDVDQKGWRERKRIVVMRNKLEATLAAMFELSEAIDLLSKTAVDANPEDHLAVARNKLGMFTTLYFPELRMTATVVKLVSQELGMSFMGMGNAFRLYRVTHEVDANSADTAKTLAEFEVIRDQHLARFPGIYQRFRAASAEFSKAAQAEMQKYAP